MRGLCTAFYNKYTKDDAATTAMHLLQSGVGIDVIALWLGHETPATTHHYVEADLTMKDQSLAHLQEPGANVSRRYAPDSLMEFLKGL